MRRVEAVVFDVGETIVDETRSWTAYAEEVGVTPLTLFGVLGALIERGADHREVWGALGVPAPQRRVAIEARDLYPDVVPCLAELAARGLLLGLAGNQPAEAESESELARLGVPVGFVASSTGWGVAKPSPEFFARVVDAAGVPADRIAYVGDRLDNDVLPARAAGMCAVFIRRGPWGYLHAHREEVGRADLVIESLAELSVGLAGLG